MTDIFCASSTECKLLGEFLIPTVCYISRECDKCRHLCDLGEGRYG